MDKKLVLITFAALVLLACIIKVEAAGTGSVYVDLYFNIGAVDELTVTLLGLGAVTSDPGGQATPANIEFNVSASPDPWENATVTEAGSTQDLANPILELDNTGTTNLEINISINDTLPSNGCIMILRYINDSAVSGVFDISGKDPETDGAVVSTTNITINSSYTPVGENLGLWLYGNFSGCADEDDAVRRFTMWATSS